MKSDIYLNQYDVKRLKYSLKRLERFSQTDFYNEVNKAGLQMQYAIKKPPIPVDTGNMRNSIRWNGTTIMSAATYSGYLEFGTEFQKAQPFFYYKVRVGIAILLRNVQTKIQQILRG